MTSPPGGVIGVGALAIQGDRKVRTSRTGDVDGLAGLEDFAERIGLGGDGGVIRVDGIPNHVPVSLPVDFGVRGVIFVRDADKYAATLAFSSSLRGASADWRALATFVSGTPFMTAFASSMSPCLSAGFQSHGPLGRPVRTGIRIIRYTLTYLLQKELLQEIHSGRGGDSECSVFKNQADTSIAVRVVRVRNCPGDKAPYNHGIAELPLAIVAPAEDRRFYGVAGAGTR